MKNSVSFLLRQTVRVSHVFFGHWDPISVSPYFFWTFVVQTGQKALFPSVNISVENWKRNHKEGFELSCQCANETTIFFFDPFPCSSAFSSFLACAPCARSKDFKSGQCYSEHKALHQCFDVALTKFAVDTHFDVRGRRKWEQLHQVPCVSKKTIKIMWKMSRINGKYLSIRVSFVFLTMLFHLHRVH